MGTKTIDIRSWIEKRVLKDEITRFMDDEQGFIKEGRIEAELEKGKKPDREKIRDIMAKSYAIESLSLEETSALLNVTDPELWQEMEDLAGKIKRKVYDNRIVTFAPLYIANLCVNNCVYCGFRKDNHKEKRRMLSAEEVKKEAEVLAGKIGHKRLIVVYGEHPLTDVDYIAETVQAIYDVKVKTKHGFGQIRRANLNIPPFGIQDLKRLHQVGIGTYQVFQETYHRSTYEKIHPQGTIKGDYFWRLYVMHRALEAGIDDVGIGALFGLYDWKFEVMGLVAHALELEAKFGIGPHTISFPRIEPAANVPFCDNPAYKVEDEAFKKLVTVIRLAVPYTGMILTARENAQLRKKVIPLGCTQTDASSRIGIGAYHDQVQDQDQEGEKQQFILGDTRSLDEVVCELAENGYITSFCTAGYRCGRTGKKIMDLLRCGREGNFCKMNAVLTFREWLDDFASEKTKQVGEKVIAAEMEEIRQKLPKAFPQVKEYYERIEKGERDLYF